MHSVPLGIGSVLHGMRAFCCQFALRPERGFSNWQRLHGMRAFCCQFAWQPELEG